VTYTMTAAANHLTGAQLDVRWRSTHYENDHSQGWMHTLATGCAISARWMVELFGGVRNEQSKVFSASDFSTTWIGADMDVDIGRSLYWNLSGEHNGGGDESYDQVYMGLSWRF